MARTPKPKPASKAKVTSKSLVKAKSEPSHGKAHKVGVVGAVVGLAAAGTAAGVAISRIAARRVRAAELGDGGALAAELVAAHLREDDPLGAATRHADRSAIVQADDGVLLHVEEIGPRDAPLTVVFVHGYTLSMASWTFQRRTLAAELATANGHRPDVRLVFYDQRGHGASGRGEAKRSTIEQLARDLDAVLETRVPRGPVVLVGHSMGGMTIMGLAALRPELFGSKVVAAALISTSSGNLADLSFGMPELLTRVRAAFFPVAAWTMRRRPALAERTRRLTADLVSTITRLAVVRLGRRRPGSGAVRRRDDRRDAGRRDRRVLPVPGRPRRDRFAGAAARDPDAGAHRRQGQDDPEGAQRPDHGAARAGGGRHSRPGGRSRRRPHGAARAARPR